LAFGSESTEGVCRELQFFGNGEKGVTVLRFPAQGVPDLYISSFAPADYMETVNTQGIPYYSKIEPLAFNKGVAGEAQSNPLHLCTRPLAQILLEL